MLRKVLLLPVVQQVCKQMYGKKFTDQGSNRELKLEGDDMKDLDKVLVDYPLLVSAVKQTTELHPQWWSYA